MIINCIVVIIDVVLIYDYVSKKKKLNLAVIFPLSAFCICFVVKIFLYIPYCNKTFETLQDILCSYTKIIKKNLFLPQFFFLPVDCCIWLVLGNTAVQLLFCVGYDLLSLYGDSWFFCFRCMPSVRGQIQMLHHFLIIIFGHQIRHRKILVLYEYPVFEQLLIHSTVIHLWLSAHVNVMQVRNRYQKSVVV